MFIIFAFKIPIDVMGIVIASVTLITHMATMSLSNKRQANTIRLAVYWLVLTLLLMLPATNCVGIKVNWTIRLDTAFMTRHAIFNVLLLVPLAYYWRLTFVRHWCIIILVIYIIAIELLQIFITGRVCDINDMLANTLGVVIGSLAAIIKQSIARRQF